jgi:hypothetical protein
MISVSMISVSPALPRPSRDRDRLGGRDGRFKGVGGTTPAMVRARFGKAVTVTVAATSKKARDSRPIRAAGGGRPARKTKIFMRHKRGFQPSDKYGHCNHYRIPSGSGRAGALLRNSGGWVQGLALELRLTHPEERRFKLFLTYSLRPERELHRIVESAVNPRPQDDHLRPL